MSKGQPKETQSKKAKIIFTLMRELLDWSSKDSADTTTLKEMNSVQVREQDNPLLDFGKYFFSMGICW